MSSDDFILSLGATATASGASGPEFPGVASPAEDFLGASEVLSNGARGSATIAWSPVGWVNLPKTNIFGTIGVVELSVSVSTALVLSDALAAWLRPAWVLGASWGDVSVGRWGAALAVIASSWRAVSTTGVGDNEGKAEGEEQSDLGYGQHLYIKIYYKYPKLTQKLII